MQRDQIISKLKELKEHFDKYQVTSVSIFGSAARNEINFDSDIDILIDFSEESHIGLFGLSRLQKAIQQAFNYKVDIVTRDALHPALKESILNEAVHVS